MGDNVFDLSSLLIPAFLFFALGVLASVIRSDLRFPPELAKALSIYLLVGIGLKGGIELAESDLGVAFGAVLVALALGFLLPLIAYVILWRVGRFDKLNAAAVAAHYGSVSAGTFLVAIAFLDSHGVDYESYPVIMLAVMESPAILVGLFLAKLARSGGDEGSEANNNETRRLVLESVTNGSVVLLLGGMFIGYFANPGQLEAVEPFYTEIFMGALTLFLLEMGMEAGRRLESFRQVGFFLVAFGLAMPLIGAAFGLFAGHYVLGLSVGGTTLVAVLAASASYIAVPPAMRLAIPEANPSYYLTLALGITFPFNVVVGVPLYYIAAVWLAG